MSQRGMAADEEDKELTENSLGRLLSSCTHTNHIYLFSTFNRIQWMASITTSTMPGVTVMIQLAYAKISARQNILVTWHCAGVATNQS